MIIGAHTHEIVKERIFKGPDGKKVLYTQAGCHSNAVGKAELSFEKKKDKMKLENIEITMTKFPKDEKDPEDDAYEAGFRKIPVSEYMKMSAKNPDIYLDYVLMMKENGTDLPMKGKDYEVTNLYHYNERGEKSVIYYLKSKNPETVKKMLEKYSPEMINQN